MKNTLTIKITISLVALIAIIAHLIWPDLKIDVVTLGLLALFILPWLTSIIESAELPGGWKVKFRDVQSAGEAIAKRATTALDNDERFVVDTDDPNLALVALRIEIEKRLNTLMQKHRLRNRGTAKRHLEDLQKAGVLDTRSIDGLQQLLGLANRAAHGAKVDPAVADWAAETGPRILGALDDEIAAK